MDHSTAIMEEAGAIIDKAAAPPATDSPAAPAPAHSDVADKPEGDDDGEKPSNNGDNQRKRKGNFPDSSIRHGSRRGGKQSDGDNKRHKKGDMGRADYFRSDPDKRAKAAANQQRRENGENKANYATTFSKEEIDAEGRKPKRKVAVMIGYSGTGFKGMQISPSEETIEGELFKAFVKAGAISKANADDPRKASLVRCARTDKNVHAAGNMISLKLIVEDPDIVEKINENLHPQIRVWGIERTIGSFSCYQACDSRWYEYLIPTLAFLPPHPSSWLAKNLERLADEAGDREGYESRQADVKDYWPKVEEEQIKAILETIDEDIRWDVVNALLGEEEASAKAVKPDADADEPAKSGASVKDENPEVKVEKTEVKEEKPEVKDEKPEVKDEKPDVEMEGTTEQANKSEGAEATAPIDKEHQDRVKRLRAATKAVRAAYNAAKRRYRITEARIDRVQQALNNYLGTRNYHNYTIQKAFKDPSANRHIKSFVVNRKPILIGDGPEEDKTEWLSLKVHGQSFMMHQIRKMIGMVTLLVRSGSDIDKTMAHSFTAAKYSIPKVPGLGLMLERPVFDSYNTMQASKHEREPLRFDKYDDKIEEFKHREIYGRMFAEEQQKGEFGRFFNHVDNFKEPYFLYVSSKGLEATEGWGRKEGYGEVKVGADSDNEGGAGEA